MGLGPPVIELYRQLKLQGALEGITEVMELGSQDFWCPQKNLVIALCKAFGRTEVNPVLLNTTNATQQPARLLYEAIGIKYGCVDVDGRVGSVVMDLNFDEVPPVHKGKYGLVTNHGTSEHTLNMASSTTSRISLTPWRVTIPMKPWASGSGPTGSLRVSFPGIQSYWTT